MDRRGVATYLLSVANRARDVREVRLDRVDGVVVCTAFAGPRDMPTGGKAGFSGLEKERLKSLGYVQ